MCKIVHVELKALHSNTVCTMVNWHYLETLADNAYFFNATVVIATAFRGVETIDSSVADFSCCVNCSNTIKIVHRRSDYVSVTELF